MCTYQHCKFASEADEGDDDDDVATGGSELFPAFPMVITHALMLDIPCAGQTVVLTRTQR